MKSNKTMNKVCIAILPLPAQGHLNQLLHLALRLSSHSIPVHYVGSSTHNRQARDRSILGSTSTEAHFLHFQDIQLPPFESPPPDPNSSSNFPSHLQPSFTASLQLLTPLHSLLLSLSSDYARVVLIHDSAMSFSTAVASSIPNVESYAFHSVSAYAILSFLNNIGFEDCFTHEFADFIASQHRMIVKDHGRLFNTCRFLEHDSISKLESDPTWKDQKVFCLGPLNPVSHNTTKQQQQRHECLAWLDKQPENSVLYISFGTTTTLSEKQIRELEHGIKATGKIFLWVLKGADRGNIYADDDHSEGCKDSEIIDSGMICRGWVPQLEVLGHEAIRGFMSHCGWNSCMESMSNGVPMMAWPMHSDQPSNARLITEVLGVGAGMREWERRNEVISGDEIKGKILKLTGDDDDDEGREVRKRAKVIGEKVRECGMNSREFNSFVDYLTR